MADCVLDASVVAFSNGDLTARRRGNVFDRRLRAIEQVIAGVHRLRFNGRLLGEYQNLIHEYRNDVIELLFALLDSSRAVLVRRNNLSRQDYAIAVRRCGWPSHDQHLLAAALGGIDSLIVVTEVRLFQCAAQILRSFDVHVERVA